MQTVGWGNRHLKNFLSMSSTMESISEHDKLSLLRRYTVQEHRSVRDADGHVA